jgi:hypothetical protein
MSEVVCEICKAVLSSKYILKTHLETNKACLAKRNITLKTNFMCDGCNLFTLDKTKLATHHEICKQYQRLLITREVEEKYEIKLKDAQHEKMLLEKEIDRIKIYYSEIITDLKVQNTKFFSSLQKLTSRVIDKPSNENIKITKLIKDIEMKSNAKEASKDVNNQLINIIVDKTKTIETLQEKIDEKDILSKALPKEESILIVNDIIIQCRMVDNYVNATQLCLVGNKTFDDWVLLDSTIELINEFQKITSLPVTLLIENDETSYWIHPLMSSYLAQWISVNVGIQVNKWLVEFDKNNTIKSDLKTKDEKIKLLENLHVKKQKRCDYPKNVIYIVTTEDNKNKRIYIVGKAKSLKSRLSTYNKTSEHEVIYYKQCKNEKEMLLIESIILRKLEKYREQANRDRFVLPIENDISLFSSIIKDTVEYLQ